MGGDFFERACGVAGGGFLKIETRNSKLEERKSEVEVRDSKDKLGDSQLESRFSKLAI